MSNSLFDDSDASVLQDLQDTKNKLLYQKKLKQKKNYLMDNPLILKQVMTANMARDAAILLVDKQNLLAEKKSAAKRAKAGRPPVDVRRQPTKTQSDILEPEPCDESHDVAARVTPKEISTPVPAPKAVEPLPPSPQTHQTHPSPIQEQKKLKPQTAASSAQDLYLKSLKKSSQRSSSNLLNALNRK